ncbi:MAG TPA: hypothetical protein VFF30_10200 [Nitrososphaerales archaeon]|nr:hypothetical protein [Nitrososphaerales archaeon]
MKYLAYITTGSDCDSFEDVRVLPYPENIRFSRYETEEFKRYLNENKEKIIDL